MTLLENLETEERSYRLTTKEGWIERVQLPERVQPSRLTVGQRQALRQVDQRRYDAARKVHHANLGPFSTPQIKATLSELVDIVDANRQDGDKLKSSAVIDSLPGVGKTTLITIFATNFHRLEIELHGERTSKGHERIPVAYISLTGNTTMRTLNSMLCTFYGHPGAQSGNAQILADRATSCVRECETRVIVIDDVHFLDMHRRNGREVANHFKWLATQFPVTFIFVGVGLEQRQLLSEGLTLSDVGLSQTARRWTRLELNPFRLETNNDRRTWRSLLLGIERELCLANAWEGMLADDLSEYLFVRSTGYFVSLMSLISRGSLRAMRTGEEKLTKELLDEIENDAASEAARQKVEDAFKLGGLKSLAPPKTKA
jgi:hypothetical protein